MTTSRFESRTDLNEIANPIDNSKWLMIEREFRRKIKSEQANVFELLEHVRITVRTGFENTIHSNMQLHRKERVVCWKSKPNCVNPCTRVTRTKERFKAY